MQFTEYETYRIPILSSGMVTSISPRQIDQAKGFSTVYKNYDSSMFGIPIKRPAYLPVDQLVFQESLTGIHFFNKQSVGEQYLIVSHNSGIAALQIKDNSETEITNQVTPGAPVYFITIADQVVFSDGGGPLNAWDGSTLKDNIGARKATMRTYLLYANNDLVFTTRDTGKSFIKVQFIKADNKTNSTTVTVSGDGNEDAPYLILVKLAWNDSKILTTANQLKTAVESNSTANSLVTVEHAPDSDGTREVTEMPERLLTGGYDAVTGKYLIEYRTRAVIADGSKLHLSHTGDPHLWSPGAAESNAVEVYVSPDDGECISGLLNMGDGGILIGKPSALYGLFGYTRDNFVVDLIDPTIGVSSHKSMVYTKPYAYWVHNSTVYCAQAGGTPERLSFPIQEELDRKVDLERIEETTALLYNRLYIVSFPAIGGGFVTYCYHIEQQSWGEWTAPQGVVDYTDYLGELYIAPVETTTIMKLVPGEFKDIDDVTIDTEITTVELDLGLIEQEKDIGDLYLVFRGSGKPVVADIEIYFDGKLTPDVVANKVVLHGNPDKQIVLRVAVGRTARFMQVSIKEHNNAQFSPLALSYTYQIKDVV